MTEPLDLPTAEAYDAAKLLWGRMGKRFERNVWQHAPAALIGAEFLTVLRSMLAPTRVELALFDAAHNFIAATLPDLVGNDDPDAPALASRAFYSEGGAACVPWRAELERAGRAEPTAADYLSAFGAPHSLPLGHGISLVVLSQGRIDIEGLFKFVASLGVANLLHQHKSPTEQFLGEWQALSRRLTDYVLHEFIDRLENDLAVMLDSDAPEIWLLLRRENNDKGPSLQFHTSRQKLERILDHYHGRERNRDKTFTVEMLIRSIDGDAVDAVESDFHRLMTPCNTGCHNDLDWSGGAEVGIDHLECIAEKFEDGWPVNRGIAGTVAATGCGEVIQDFKDDYRVKAYDYGAPTHRTPAEPDSFYRVRLAERVFIKTRPHVFELPILWGVDANGEKRCTAMLLVLFNGEAGKGPGYFSGRALAIQNAVEPWHILFEHHGRSMEWNQAINGHIVHEVRNSIWGLQDKLDEETFSDLQNDVEALWRAYSFAPSAQRPTRDRRSAYDVIQAIRETTNKALSSSSIRCDYTCRVPEAAARAANVDTMPSLIEKILGSFIKDSAALVANLVTTKQERPENAHISIEITSDIDPASSRDRLIMSVRHRVSSAVGAFLTKHRHAIGREVIHTLDGQNFNEHHGLYFVGVSLRNSGGEFLRPLVQDGWVHWRFAFPVVEGRLPPT